MLATIAPPRIIGRHLALVTALLAAVVHGHPHDGDADAHDHPAESLAINDDALDRMAGVLRQLQRDTAQRRAQAAAADSYEAATAVQALREQQLQRALRDHGLARDEYDRIHHALRHDTQLRQQLRRRIDRSSHDERPHLPEAAAHRGESRP